MTRRVLNKIVAVFLCLLMTSTAFAASVTVHFTEDQSVTLRKEEMENPQDSSDDSISSDEDGIETESITETNNNLDVVEKTEMESSTESELNSLLPTLGKVDGLVTQGGDAFAAAQAFVSAGYTKMPVIAGDNRGSFLNWWAEQEGYETLSGACNPWDGAIAMYIAVDIANGEQVANEMNCPFGYVTAENLADYKGMADDDVVKTTYDWETIKSEIETGK